MYGTLMASRVLNAPAPARKIAILLSIAANSLLMLRLAPIFA